MAIKVEEASEKSGGAKAKIYVVNAGGEYRKKDKAGQISNVKFSVPIVFPITNLKDRPDQ